MKNNLLKIGLLALFTSCTLISCNKEQKATYTITFKQNNEQDIVVKVVAGEALENVPTPVRKTGYTVVWDVKDFTNINENKVVNAIETANTYTATYSATGFSIDGTQVKFTYDSVCSNLDMSLTKYDSNLIGWSYNETIYTNKSIWNIASDVTITPRWVEKNQYVVTFVDTDGSCIFRNVYEGQDLENIPTPTLRKGYSSVVWDRTDFTNITKNIEVHAIETAKTCQVNLLANGGEVTTSYITVTFN